MVKCDNMENTLKTVIHILLTQGRSIAVFVSHPLLFKHFTDLQQILETEKKFTLAEKPKC